VYRIGLRGAKIFRLSAQYSGCRYNRYVIRPTLIAAVAVSIVLLAGCKKDMQNQEAVRQGVMSYLSKRSDLLAMDVSVSSVAFQQDEATAQVHFQAKGNSSPAAGMTIQYVLERKDGQWVVKGRTGANAAHGATSPGVNSMPGQGTSPGSLDGMPRIPGPGGSSTSLPPGHPTVGGSQALPPGHPSVSPDSTNQQK
jgi:outer membrane murein-binding lipoprotein Lpp